MVSWCQYSNYILYAVVLSLLNKSLMVAFQQRTAILLQLYLGEFKEKSKMGIASK